MAKIIVKKRGMMLSLPGHYQVRTPCELEVNEANMRFLLSELRKHGISEYKIQGDKESYVVSDKTLLKKFKKQSQKTEAIIPSEHYEQILQSVRNSEESISKVEKLLREFIEFGLTVRREENVVKEDLKKKRSKVDEKVDEFIPEINILDVKIKGKGSEKIIKSKDDISKKAEKLKNVIKEKE